MGDVHDTLERNVQVLFGQLRAQAAGSRAALLGFGEDARAAPIASPHLHTSLTANVTAFQRSATKLGSRKPAGGTNPGYTSLIEVANMGPKSRLRMGFTQGLGYCVALFTDEASNGDCQGCTKQAATSALLNSATSEAKAPGVFFGVTRGTAASQSYKGVATATGGELLSLQSFRQSPAALLQRIVAKCSYLINRVSLSPKTSTLYLGQAHTLTVRTNQLKGRTVTPQSNVPFELMVISGGIAPGWGVRGNTVGTSGTKQVVYDPYELNNNYTGGTVWFRVCRLDGTLRAGSPPCAAASATFVSRCANVVCQPKDECHGPGICNILTGLCGDGPPLDEGRCDDGNPCTEGDFCQNGACVPGSEKVCGNPEQCYGTGSCDRSTGQCVFPTLTDGTSCQDGNPCTEGDFCQNGACVPGSEKVCNDVCFDKETFGVDALCVDNCGSGTGTNCKTVCEYFRVPYFSSHQCRNVGSAEDSSGKTVVGNKVCKDNLPSTGRTSCCTCDKFA
jgi:hypothetical protein